MRELPPPLERRRKELEAKLGLAIRVRGVRTPEVNWRGRLRRSRGRILIEYQISEAGFFWHIPIIERLLEEAGKGESEAIIP